MIYRLSLFRPIQLVIKINKVILEETKYTTNSMSTSQLFPRTVKSKHIDLLKYCELTAAQQQKWVIYTASLTFYR